MKSAVPVYGIQRPKGGKRQYILKLNVLGTGFMTVFAVDSVTGKSDKIWSNEAVTSHQHPLLPALTFRHQQLYKLFLIFETSTQPRLN